jgi:hypothetical protein
LSIPSIDRTVFQSAENDSSSSDEGDSEGALKSSSLALSYTLLLSSADDASDCSEALELGLDPRRVLI